MICISASRFVVEGIITGTRKKYRSNSEEVRKNDYVEIYSALPHGGTVENHPERNALRVIVLVDKIETDRFGQKFIWKVAVPCKQPEPDHGLDDEMYEILKAIGEFSKGTEAAIPALPVSKVTGLLLQVVEDHYELLGNESLVEHIHDSSGHYAWLKPRGRNLLRGISMVKNGSQIVLPDGIHESLAKFKKDHPDEGKAAFIMMKFGRTPSHDKIIEAIRSAIKPYGIEGLRADDKQYHDELFPNIETYVHGCGFGIAVFERIETEEFNPNVSLEVGYMIGIKKPVCLLKDQTLRTLHTDLVGRLYRPFDTLDPGKTIPTELVRWLSDKGLA